MCRNVTECGTSNQEFTRACVHVVNENFSTLHSAPLLVPLQSSFLNLDVLFTGNLSTAAFPIGDPKPETDQDDDAAATITTTPTTTVTGSGSTGKAAGMRGWRTCHVITCLTCAVLQCPATTRCRWRWWRMGRRGTRRSRRWC